MSQFIEFVLICLASLAPGAIAVLLFEVGRGLWGRVKGRIEW